MVDSPLTGIILAAGKGTRMNSRLPKVMHQVCGLPMVEWSVRAYESLGIAKPIVVVGHGGDQVIDWLRDRIRPVWQYEQNGTGHAAMMAEKALQDYDGPVLIIPGDAPAIEAESLQALVADFRAARATIALATVRLDDPTGYGRIVKDESGLARKIVEEKDADSETKKLQEVGVSVYCIDAKWMFAALPRLSTNNAQGELYLTDLVALARTDGKIAIVRQFKDAEQFEGVNNRWQLAQLETHVRKAILKKHALNGVTLRNLETILIGPDVEIAPDVEIGSGSHLLGQTEISAGTTIGQNCKLENAIIGENCRVEMSVIRDSQVMNEVKIGPFAHIRQGALIGDHCRIGNFVEIKKSTLGTKVAASHLNYLGDAEIGEFTNVGAGAVIANYDGVKKHQTKIGAGVFVGSNSTVIAPVQVGDDSIITAASVLTTDLPANAGAFGRARTEIKEGWADKWREKTRAAKKKDNDVK